MEIKTEEQGNVFDEKLGPVKTVVMGLQHVLTMCPGSLALIIILGTTLNLSSETIAYLVSANLLTSGIAILIQVYGLGNKIGSKLPLILGSSYAPLGAMIAIGKSYDAQVLFGSIIGSAIVLVILSFALDKILKLFPPVVVGSFVTLIGISLAHVSMENMAGGAGASDFGNPMYLLLGCFVAAIVVLVGRFGGKVFHSLSLLMGMASGTAIAGMMGIVDISPVVQAEWFRIVTPFKLGLPEFKIVPIVIMTVFCLVNLIQCIGVFSVLDEISGQETSEEDKIKGLRGQAVAQAISGIFCSVPGAMFAENVGLMNLTGAKGKGVIKSAGFILILLGIIPKFASVITVIPKPVLGGATLVLFGIITASGISILTKLKFTEDNNFTIVGTSMILGVAATFVGDMFPTLPPTAKMLLGSPLFVVSISAIILNLVLNINSEFIKVKLKSEQGA